MGCRGLGASHHFRSQMVSFSTGSCAMHTTECDFTGWGPLLHTAAEA
jgi:hypothetical protein